MDMTPRTLNSCNTALGFYPYPWPWNCWDWISVLSPCITLNFKLWRLGVICCPNDSFSLILIRIQSETSSYSHRKWRCTQSIAISLSHVRLVNGLNLIPKHHDNVSISYFPALDHTQSCASETISFSMFISYVSKTVMMLTFNCKDMKWKKEGL